jgi:hypothetical protein
MIAVCDRATVALVASGRIALWNLTERKWKLFPANGETTSVVGNGRVCWFSQHRNGQDRVVRFHGGVLTPIARFVRGASDVKLLSAGPDSTVWGLLAMENVAIRFQGSSQRRLVLPFQGEGSAQTDTWQSARLPRTWRTIVQPKGTTAGIRSGVVDPLVYYGQVAMARQYGDHLFEVDYFFDPRFARVDLRSKKVSLLEFGSLLHHKEIFYDVLPISDGAALVAGSLATYVVSVNGSVKRLGNAHRKLPESSYDNFTGPMLAKSAGFYFALDGSNGDLLVCTRAEAVDCAPAAVGEHFSSLVSYGRGVIALNDGRQRIEWLVPK